jgi:hypothetical protein
MEPGSPPDFWRLQEAPGPGGDVAGAKVPKSDVRVEVGRGRSGTEQRVFAAATGSGGAPSEATSAAQPPLPPPPPSSWEPFAAAAVAPQGQWQRDAAAAFAPLAQRHLDAAFARPPLAAHGHGGSGGLIELTPRGSRHAAAGLSLREPSPEPATTTPPSLLMAPVAAPDDELAAAHGGSSISADGGGGRGRTLSSPEDAPFGSSTASSAAAASGGRREGALYQHAPASALLPFWKRWRSRHAVLAPDGLLRLWESAGARMRGAPPAATLRLHEAMALTPMRTATVRGGAPLFYRSLVDVGRGDKPCVEALPAAGFTLRDGDDGSGGSGSGTSASTLLTYGAPSVGELDAWSAALRAHVAAAHARAYGASPGGGDDPALVAGGAASLSAADLFLEALASPGSQQRRRHRRRRRSSAFGDDGGGGGGGGDADEDEDAGTSSPWRWQYAGDAAPAVDSDGGGGVTRVGITVLDGMTLPLALPARASVRDALLAVRAALGLRADADFALHLRSWNGATRRHEHVCLPDVTPLEEAAQLALPEGRELVYKRRIYLPPSLAAEPPAAESGAEGGGGSGGSGSSGRRRQPGSAVDGGGGGSSSGSDGDEPGAYGLGQRGMPDSPSGSALDFDAEAAAAAGPHAAAHRLAYADACYNLAAGNYQASAEFGRSRG